MKILPIAAIVLEFGDDEQSPMANTFGYLTCCKVAGLTSTKPAALLKPFVGSNKTDGALCGGTACKIEYWKKHINEKYSRTSKINWLKL